MDQIISTLQASPAELVSLLLILVTYVGTLVMFRLFGLKGLIALAVVAVIAANIQVLKVTEYSFLSHPVALGTEVFVATYLISDIITEYYGEREARQAIWTVFACQLLFTTFMVITLGFAPVADADMAGASTVESALQTLVKPQFALLAAGMFSYLVSQHLDIWVFARIKHAMHDRQLWLRNLVSNMIAALVDNTIFSTLAWVVFASNPIGLEPLIFTYILGTFWIRMIISIGDVPFLYLTKRLYRDRHQGAAHA